MRHPGPSCRRTFVCVALFEGGAINCRSESVDCPRYLPPSSRHGTASFSGEGWTFSYPRGFSLYDCVGKGFNTGYTEVGVSNFDARAGYFGSTWPRREHWPRDGVFLIVGGYATDLVHRPQTDSRFPLSLESFHHIPGFDFRPGVARQVWSHGDDYFVQIYLGPAATPRDHDAIKAVLRSLRI